MDFPSIPQEYIARFGRGQLAKQAQSKEKVLSKMVAGGLTEKVMQDKVSASGYTVSMYLWFYPHVSSSLI